jgi:hypothetical protein
MSASTTSFTTETAASSVSVLLSEVEAGGGISLDAAGRMYGVNGSTVFRHHRRGVKLPDGSLVRLQALRIGRKIVTTKEAVRRFLEVLNSTADPAMAEQAAALRSPAARQRNSAKASAALDAAGW